MKYATVIALLSLLAPLIPAATPSLTLEQLSENVFVFRPTPEAFDTWRTISNSGAVVFDDGILVYDSHWTPELAEEALGLLRNHTDAPVRWVVSSHFHADHTGGFWAYHDDVEILAHHSNRERLAADHAALPEQLLQDIVRLEQQLDATDDPVQRTRFGNFLAYSRAALERIETGTSPPLPTVTFERRVVLHEAAGAEVLFLGRGHTAGDAILLLREQDLAFLGDLLFTGTLPNTGDGFVKDWIATLEAALGLGVNRFVPGHGPVSTADEIRSQIAYLTWLREAVEPYARDGKEVEAAQRDLTLPDRWADHEFAFFFTANVATVHAELVAERSANANDAGLDIYRDVAVAQLAPWRESGITRELLERADTAPRRLVRYQIIDGRIYRSADCMFPRRCSGIEHFLHKLAPRVPDVTFLVNVQDPPVSDVGDPLPIFSFSKVPGRHADILYPAWAFWEGGPAVDVIPRWRWDLMRHNLLDEGARAPWLRKKNVVFFRGSRTNADRDSLILHSLEHPDRWDVRFTPSQSKQVNDHVQRVMGLETAATVTPADHCAYRYLLNFDGIAASFRLRNILPCGSTVLYANPTWVEFFYARLEPWEHYVPIGLDAVKAEQTLNLLAKQPDLARRIARNGREFIERELTLDHVERYWLSLLEEYAALQRFAPSPDPKLSPLER